MPPVTKLRSDTQLAGRALVLGGTDPNSLFGDVGAGSLTVKKNTPGTVSPTFIVEAVLPTDIVATIGGSLVVQGNLTVNGTSETVTNSLTVNGNTTLGNNSEVDTVMINGGLTVVCGTGANLDAVIRGDFKVKKQDGSSDLFTVVGGFVALTLTVSTDLSTPYFGTAMTVVNSNVTLDNQLLSIQNQVTDGSTKTNSAFMLRLFRQDIATAGSTINKSGAVLLLVNGNTQIAGGVVNDTSKVLWIIQDGAASGDAVKITNNGSGFALETDGANGDVMIGGNLIVAGTITGGKKTNLKQYATYASEPGLSSGPGDPGWSTAVDGASGAILRLETVDDFSGAGGLGDGVSPATVALGNQVSVNTFIPINVYRDGLLLRAGSGQEYTIAAVSGLIEVTFVNPIFTDTRLVFGFNKKS